MLACHKEAGQQAQGDGLQCSQVPVPFGQGIAQNVSGQIDRKDAGKNGQAGPDHLQRR